MIEYFHIILERLIYLSLNCIICLMGKIILIELPGNVFAVQEKNSEINYLMGHR